MCKRFNVVETKWLGGINDVEMLGLLNIIMQNRYAVRSVMYDAILWLDKRQNNDIEPVEQRSTVSWKWKPSCLYDIWARNYI